MRSTNNFAVQVQDVWESFRVYHERSYTLKEKLVRLTRSSYENFWALKGINFEVNKGETLGIIGENGSGKSTLLKCIARILVPTRGRIIHDGRICALIELGAGFHPDLTGRENVFLNGAMLGMSRKQVRERFDDIIKFAELEQFIDTPVRNYSSGMYLRLGFALAVHSDPDILLIDEVLSVGDEAFQRKCIDKIQNFKKSGVTTIYVSHTLASVARLCDRTILLAHGEMKSEGDPRKVIATYFRSIGVEYPTGFWQEGRERYEEYSDRVSATGTWRIGEDEFCSAGSLIYSDTPGDSVTFSFEGSNVAWIDVKEANRGIAKVYIDDKYECEVDEYSPDRKWQSEVFRKTGLSSGMHTLRVEVIGRRNGKAIGSYVAVDAFDVW